LPTDERLRAYNRDKSDLGMEALLFQYGRYLLISSSRRGGLPANLQGLWNNEVKPAWYSQYTTNINIQMNYWLAEQTNLSEVHDPMLDWVENLGKVQKTSTDSVLKTTAGWVAYSTNNIMGGSSKWRLHRPGSAWMSRHFWERFNFTQDTAFLRDRAYPYLKEIVQYWEGHLIENKDGKLITPDGWSPEHGPGKNEGDKNPYPGASYDQQIIYDLFTNYISAAKVLKHTGLRWKPYSSNCSSLRWVGGDSCRSGWKTGTTQQIITGTIHTCLQFIPAHKLIRAPHLNGLLLREGHSSQGVISAQAGVLPGR
jgi:alpha-L-fucosidase 2